MKTIRSLPILTLAAAAALALTPGAFAQTTGTGSTETGSQGSMTSQRTQTTQTGMGEKVSRMDRDFAKKAAEGGLAEVELGRLAADKGSSEEVKSFGRRMVDDHTKANDELKTIAASKGITLPTDTDRSHKTKMSKLQNLTGAEFDKAYVKEQVKDHDKDMKLFQKEADKGKDPELKAFAQKTLTTLHDHMQTIDQIASNVGVRGRRGTQLPAAGKTGRETGTASQGAGTSSPNPTP